ncbi:FecR domain-containing protein [Breoghania sp.]|uniref:FecR family protein n=1 Tax=Breoghania sp. TaxID=2065378 RepID=UPI002AAB2881|nr:FecR domain-containing protein [Breoghania sp.]
MIRYLFLGLAVACAVASPATSAEQIGSAFAITGSVTGELRSSPVRALSPGSDIHFKEHIRARPAANGQFRLIDGSHLVVGAGSDVVLDEFVYKGGAVRARLKLTKGTLRFLGSGNRPGQDRVSITTPVATVGIRGTVVDVTHSPNRTAFLLLHGSAQVCRRGGGCRMITEPCTGVIVTRGVSGVDRRAPAELAADFPLLAQQPRLWPSFRAESVCGVSPVVNPPERGSGKSAQAPSDGDKEAAVSGSYGGYGGYGY